MSRISRLESDAFRRKPLLERPIPVNPLKAASDKLLALAFLILTAPLWIFIIAMTALLGALFPEDRGPLFFWEERISQGGRFRIPKFRILRVDVIEREMAEPGVFSVRFHQKDANCTRLGRWLKKYYLDELPQLMVILSGRMSFVGPRPRIPEEYAKDLAEGFMARKYLRTGLTGMNQLNKARIGEPGLDRYLDEQYLRAAAHLSPFGLFALDTEILWRTIWMMAKGEGL